MHLLQTMPYDNADKATMADRAHDEAREWAADGYMVEVRDRPDHIWQNGQRITWGGAFEIWGEENV